MPPRRTSTPYLYAGLSDVTALAETLLRDIASDERGYRVVPNDKALGRKISRLTLTQDLDLVSLIDGRDLGAIGQDDWLVSCPPRDYPQTRGWVALATPCGAQDPRSHLGLQARPGRPRA